MGNIGTLLKIGYRCIFVFFSQAKGKYFLKMNFTECSNCHFVMPFYCHITRSHIFNQQHLEIKHLLSLSWILLLSQQMIREFGLVSGWGVGSKNWRRQKRRLTAVGMHVD